MNLDSCNTVVREVLPSYSFHKAWRAFRFRKHWEWLIDQADSELNSSILPQRLTPATAHVTYYLAEEKLELWISFHNASLWPLHVDTAEGYVIYGEVALKRKPELFGWRDIGRGLVGSITLNQFIDADELAKLKQKATSSGDRLILNLRKLDITLSANAGRLAGRSSVAFRLPLGEAYPQITRDIL